MTIVSRVHVQYPGSQFRHWYTLLANGQVLRSTDGVDREADCGTFPELKSREDLLAKLARQGYEEIDNGKEVSESDAGSREGASPRSG